MSHNEPLKHSDPENLKTTASSNSSNRKAYIIVAIISFLLIISGVIYWVKFQEAAETKTESTKTKTGSNETGATPKKVQSIDRIFFIKSNFRKVRHENFSSDEEIPPVTSELYSVLSDGTDLKHYTKAAEVDKLVFGAYADAKNKSLIVHSFDATTNNYRNIFIQDWDSDEIFKPDSAITDGFGANLFPDGSKIIFCELNKEEKVDKYGSRQISNTLNICTFDLKGKEKVILKT